MSPPQTHEPDLRVELQIESGRVTVIRCEPLAPKRGEDRPRDKGPFGASIQDTGVGVEIGELLDELLRVTKTRTRLAHDQAIGRREGSWGPLVVGCLAADAPFVITALAHLFDRHDPEPLREFLKHPPALPRGVAWEPPTPS